MGNMYGRAGVKMCDPVLEMNIPSEGLPETNVYTKIEQDRRLLAKQDNSCSASYSILIFQMASHLLNVPTVDRAQGLQLLQACNLEPSFFSLLPFTEGVYPVYYPKMHTLHFFVAEEKLSGQIAMQMFSMKTFIEALYEFIYDKMNSIIFQRPPAF